jgi:hypothetical protein
MAALTSSVWTPFDIGGREARHSNVPLVAGVQEASGASRLSPST